MYLLYIQAALKSDNQKWSNNIVLSQLDQNYKEYLTFNYIVSFLF